MHEKIYEQSSVRESPVRILHVLGRLNRGGAETMIMNIYREIDRSQIQFDFIIHTEEKCDYEDEIRCLGGEIFNIPRYSGKNHFSYKNAWHSFFKKHPEYKVIHGHMRSTATIYLNIAKKYGLKTIAHSHSSSSGSGLSAVVKNIYQYPIRYIADYLFACSESAGVWLFGERACRKDNFFIINNAIDVNEFIYNKDIGLKKKREFGIEGKFVIGHVGRFNTSKNHELLLDIFRLIHSKDDNTVLMLVGDGELREILERKVTTLGLKNSVIFAGNRSDTNELLQSMDIFVFPSLYEGLGIAAVEAQASGLHCIVSDKIPKEAFATDLVEVIPLNSSFEIWADKILMYAKGYTRKITYNQLKSCGYDIVESTKWVKCFYLKVHKDIQ